MPAVRAIPACARSTARFGHARDGLAAALRKEDRQLAPGVLPTADGARDGIIRLAHLPQGLKNIFTILANIFVNRHGYLNDKSLDAEEREKTQITNKYTWSRYEQKYTALLDQH